MSLRCEQVAFGQFLWTCPTCKWDLLTDSREPVLHTCGKEMVQFFGTKCEFHLGRLGVSADKFREAVKEMGWPGNCDKSKAEWLAALDEKLQLGDKARHLRRLLGWRKAR